MRETVKRAKADSYRKILVETYSDDTFKKARTFYKRYGFGIIGGISNYIEKGTDMVVFGLDL
jgi:ribosomal protein S18 acetylase RimI-like enzyme